MRQRQGPPGGAPRARWREECAEAKLYWIEVKKARANHTDPPPHYQHNKVAWKKWREAQQVKQLGGSGRGVIGDLLAEQRRADERRLERERRLH